MESKMRYTESDSKLQLKNREAVIAHSPMRQHGVNQINKLSREHGDRS